ncbi:hypothetical protein BH09MYX1_BH09MYX1_35040 [soil metagenome]
MPKPKSRVRTGINGQTATAEAVGKNLLVRVVLRQVLRLALVTVIGVLSSNIAWADFVPPGLSDTQVGSAGDGTLPGPSAQSAPGGADVDLSSGAAVAALQFVLPRARGDAQPKLSLSYDSRSRDGEAGFGWSLRMPAISRKNLSGLPVYAQDPPQGTPITEFSDRFTFMGAPLVPLCTVGATTCPPKESFGQWLGWHYFRPQSDSMRARFFWSPNGRTWRVEFVSGLTLEFGAPSTRPMEANGIDFEDWSAPSPTQAYRWNLIREWDATDSVVHPNQVVYRWTPLGASQRKYLTDIYDTPSQAQAAQLADGSTNTTGFAHHTHLYYEDIPGPLGAYGNGIFVPYQERLLAVDVMSARSSGVGERELVRRYHLRYLDAGRLADRTIRRSLLVGVREDGASSGGLSNCAPISESTLPAPTTAVCSSLPEVTMSYTGVDSNGGFAYLPEGQDFNGAQIEKSPQNVPEISRPITFFDVDSDGRPDILSAYTRDDIGTGCLQGGGLNYGWSNHVYTYRNVLRSRSSSGTPFAPPPASSGQDPFALSAFTQNPDLPCTVSFPGGIYFPERVIGGDWLGNSHANTLLLTATLTNVPICVGGGFGCTPPPPQYAYRWSVLEALSDRAKGSLEWRIANPNSPTVAAPTGTEIFGDLDADGLPDMLTSTATYRSSRGPNGIIKPFSQAGPAPPFAPNPTLGQLADVDGDGLLDYAETLGTGSSITIHTYLGTGRGFGAQTWTPLQLTADVGAPQGYSTKVYLHDVNGDGLADAVHHWYQGTYSMIEVFFNTGAGPDDVTRTVVFTSIGLSWPQFASTQLAFADIAGTGSDSIIEFDGTGTFLGFVDVLSGNAQRPFLLQSVNNGRGATSRFSYDRTTDLAAKWGWARTSPRPMDVVSRLELSTVTQGVILDRDFFYSDPVVDGWTHQFRGFRRARERSAPGQSIAQNVVHHQHHEVLFSIHECPLAQELDACDPSDYDDDALKSLPALAAVEHTYGDSDARSDDWVPTNPIYKSTIVRRIDVPNYALSPIDGRNVRLPRLAQEDIYLYDSVPGSTSTITATVVDEVTVDHRTFDGDARRPIITPLGITQSTQVVTLGPSAGMKHLRHTFDYDALGNAKGSTDWGELGVDMAVSRSVCPDLAPSTDWTWRNWCSSTPKYSQQTGMPPARDRSVGYRYNSSGQLVEVDAFVDGSIGVQRRHEDPNRAFATLPPANASSQLGPHTAALMRLSYGGWAGRLARAVDANGGCAEIGYDTVYQLLPQRDDRFRGGCGVSPLTTVRSYDAGTGVITQLVDPSGATTAYLYDNFGRLREVREADPSNQNVTSPSPASTIEYVDLTDGPSVIHTVSSTSAESFAFVDGLGRTILTLDKADSTGSRWAANGLPDYTGADRHMTTFQPWFYSGSPLAFPLTMPGSRAIAQETDLDAFGRPIQTLTLDRFGYATRRVFAAIYHALSVHQSDETTSSVRYRNGHGDLVRVDTPRGFELDTTLITHQSTGEPATIVRKHTDGTDISVRWMQYDSLGRLVLNAEPNSAKNFASDPNAAGGMSAWRYDYDDGGRLVATSDARGCGENTFYDRVGRIVAEDYSPCKSSQTDYTPPNLSTGDGTESFHVYDAPEAGEPPGDYGSLPALVGREVATFDRGAHRRYAYDARGRLTGESVRPVRPGAPAALLANRYAGAFRRAIAYDDADRATSASTGADVQALMGTGGVSEVTSQWDGAGRQTSISSSYDRSTNQPMLAMGPPDADGLPTGATFGDIAGTTVGVGYDPGRRINSKVIQRAAPSIWSSPPSGYTPPPTQGRQLTLESVAIGYEYSDVKTLDRSGMNAGEWPPGAAPQSVSYLHDVAHRVYSASYATPAVDPPNWAAFSPEAAANDVRTLPQRAISTRIASQSFDYNWMGDMTSSGDDKNIAFFDRSLGVASQTAGPNQLTGANGGALAAHYDDAGNLVDLVVDRSGAPCANVDGACSERFVFDWDEVGNLMRGRRWDSSTTPSNSPFPSVPSSTPRIDDSFSYSGLQRIVKSQSFEGAAAIHDVRVFPSLLLYGATFDEDYRRDETTEAIYLGESGRVVYDPALPTTDGTSLHVFYSIHDILGTATTLIDQDTSEVVEKRTAQAFGQIESDYRPVRWRAFRENLRFTGQPDDTDLGLIYFGARYYNPALMRWMSPDPLAIHQLAGDANPYSYVRNSPAGSIDLLGLTDWNGDRVNDGEQWGWGQDGIETVKLIYFGWAHHDHWGESIFGFFGDAFAALFGGTTSGVTRPLRTGVDGGPRHWGGVQQATSASGQEVVLGSGNATRTMTAIGAGGVVAATGVGVVGPTALVATTNLQIAVAVHAPWTVRVVGAGTTIVAALNGNSLQGPTVRGPPATIDLAMKIQGDTPLSRQTIALLETAEGPTLVGGGSADLTEAQIAVAEAHGLTPTALPDFHAEQTVINGAGEMGLTPTNGVATNNVCLGRCGALIRLIGGRFNGKYFGF